MASLDQAAAHCFVSSQRFRELLARGAIAKAERGRYDLDQVREQFIRHLSKMAAGRNDSGSKLTEERTRLVAAKRRREERADAIEAGRVVRLAPARRVIELMFINFRSHALNLPGECAHELEMRSREEVFEILDRAVRAKLEELSDPERAAAEVIRAGIEGNIHTGDDDDEDEATDAA